MSGMPRPGRARPGVPHLPAPAALLPVRRQRPRLPGALDAAAGARVRRHGARREHRARGIHGRPGARQRRRRDASPIAFDAPARRLRRSPKRSSRRRGPGDAVGRSTRRGRCTSSCTCRLRPASTVIGVVRLLLSFAVLVVPTTLMGATLPLVVKSALGRGRDPRPTGLACSTRATRRARSSARSSAGIWMVPQLGISWAFRVRRAREPAGRGRRVAARGGRAQEAAVADAGIRRERRSQRRGPDGPAASLCVRRLVLLTFAVSGFVSFALGDHLVPHAGRAAPADDLCVHRDARDGARRHRASAAGSRRRSRAGGDSTRSPSSRFSSCCSRSRRVLSMHVIGRAGSTSTWAGPGLRRTARSRTSDRWPSTSIAAILPAALLMGMAFPIGIAIWASDVGDAQRRRTDRRDLRRQRGRRRRRLAR